ncbi:MAG: 7-cyano-7-deazaguanine synthase QueC [Thiotrichaceae bacterium]|nr:7-cyano-7-deazaguanine synthase QueC [Thiotrichaceae bacterium]PCI10500.1 MAG: 7-cyano-7-deazaguanine synthase QueC [Thiotrichales bacterium]
MRKAVVLLSGGLDSTTVLALAQATGYDCYTISFDYGQRHNFELEAAAAIAAQAAVAAHKVIRLDLGAIGGSALTDPDIAVPQAAQHSDVASGIPVTYVPARNTVFLSLALGWAEVLGAQDIFIGVNAVDYSGYPDCRPAFIEAFEHVANLATKAGVEGLQMTIHTPLIAMSKGEIIQAGSELGIDYGRTVSCYRADEAGRACGRCDACHLRTAGFEQAGLPDPTPYLS